MKKPLVLKALMILIPIVFVVSACSQTGVTSEPQATLERAETSVAAEPMPTETSVAVREIVKLKIGIVPYISNTILMIAENEGFFDEQDLDVEFVQFPNTNDLVPLVLAGELDAGPPSVNAALFNAIARGGNIKIIMPLTDFVIKDCATVAFLARTSDVEAGIYTDKMTWTDAKMVISPLALNSIPGYVLAKVVEPAGLTVDDMKTEVVDAAAQEEALRNKQIDILYAVEPTISRMTSKGDIAILENAEKLVPGLASSVIVAGPKIIDNPDVGQRFAIAYLKAVRQYMQGPTSRNVELAVELSKLSPELVSKICWSNSSRDGVLNVRSILDYEKWLMTRGLLDKLIEPSDFYDPSFAEFALKELGTVEP